MAGHSGMSETGECTLKPKNIKVSHGRDRCQ